MRFLLDTHFVLAFLQREFAAQFPRYNSLFAEGTHQGFVSVVSLWEIAIKSRLGKLEPGVPLGDMASILEDGELSILPIEVAHVSRGAGAADA
jgi:PIN domain nuclease of toxin-antitoxin system